MTLIHWLAFAGVTFVSFFPFQWLFYTGIRNAQEKVIFGHAFSSGFAYFLVCALIINGTMVLPNTLSFFIGGVAYHEWFHKAWILHLTYAAINLGGAIAILWLQFGELPTKGALVGLALMITGSLISIFWK